MKKGILTLCWLALAAPAYAGTIYCTNCSSSAMQALERAIADSQLAELKTAYDQYVQQTAAQLQMVQQNIEQYANMVQNTVQLPANLIGEISGELSKLGKITGTLNTLRNDITGMAGVFDELYRTRDELKELANMPKELLSGEGSTRYEGYWDNWSKRVDDAAKSTFQLSASQLQELENSGQLEDYINRLLSTPDGQQKAIMAGNQLAALQIQESRQLRELVATKFQSDLSEQQRRQRQEQLAEEISRAKTDFSSLNFTPTDDPRY